MVKPIRIEKPPPVKRFGKVLDFNLGFALLRDGRVATHLKVFALIIALGIIAFIEVLELPLEEILIAVVPFLGFIGDVLLVGIEFIFGPILLASWILPYLVSSNLLDQIRYERAQAEATPPDKPIIDV